MTAVMVKIGHCPGDTQEAGEGPLEFVPDLDVYWNTRCARATRATITGTDLWRR